MKLEVYISMRDGSEIFHKLDPKKNFLAIIGNYLVIVLDNKTVKYDLVKDLLTMHIEVFENE